MKIKTNVKHGETFYGLYIGSTEHTKENKTKDTHYENTPIQIYSKFHFQKLKIFR